MPDAIPAATLVLLRDAPGGPPEIPMVGRGKHLAFAASRMVFPGGRVDDDDHVLARRSDLLVEGPAIDPEDLACRITAIRETIEEIGLAPGIAGIRDASMIGDIRRALHGGEPLSLLLERHWLRIDPHGIHPFARWRPDHEIVRRFDTRFYLAEAPLIGQATADGVESSHLVWNTADGHLATAHLIFPTIRNLEWIARARNFDEAVQQARCCPIETVTPWIEQRDGASWLCIPEGLGYPVTTQLLANADRASDPSMPSSTRKPG
ncbi:NUDIX hydrolase [Sphingomonas sp. SRS2]|uniref:NUDIX hydrolase n=1 Tax=Sphingomonas sp. SRS2 TaxID=133190 RepID=UPI001F24CF5E|nr:NUDIX hydrolase [Sphingomonas sp. SRS2]